MLSLENSDNRSVREKNRSQILQAIKMQKAVSRIDLANQIDLNPSTISRAVNDLEEMNLIQERKVGESSGGRRPVLLGINKSAYHIIGVDIGATKIIAVITDMQGNILEKDYYRIDYSQGDMVSISPELVLKSIATVLSKYQENESITTDRIIGIGVGAHGLVDRDRGKVIFAPNFGWRDIYLKERIEEEFDYKTVIDNDVRVMALGEYWFGSGQNCDSLICINAGYGIGSGMILNGRLYRGHRSLAGEIGHTTVTEDGPRCNCGDYGCLETVASGPAIAKMVRTRIKRGRKSQISDMVTDINKITGELVFQAASKGDDLSRQVLQEAGNYLGIGIANLVNIMDPELVLVGGGVSRAGDLIFTSLRQSVKNKTMEDPPPINPVKLGKETGAIGSSVLILEELFKAPESFLAKVRG